MGGVVCIVIFVSNPTVVLCCVGVGVLTINRLRLFDTAPVRAVSFCGYLTPPLYGRCDFVAI